MVIVKEFCILICVLIGVWAQVKIQPPPKSPSSTHLTLHGAISRQNTVGLPRPSTSLGLNRVGSSLSLSESMVNNAAEIRNSPTSMRARIGTPGRNSPTSFGVQNNVAPLQLEDINTAHAGRAPPPLHLRQVSI